MPCTTRPGTHPLSLCHIFAPFRLAVKLSCFLNPFLDRDVQGREFEEWVASVRKTLELNDRGSNCVTLLRQLFVLNAVTKYPRK